MSIPKPPYDAELIASVESFPAPVTTREELDQRRLTSWLSRESTQRLAAELNLVYEEHVVPVLDGESVLSIVRPAGVDRALPVMFEIHGGGMILGSRFDSFLPDTLRWAAEHELAIISPEYTLAPDAPAPRAALECHAGLMWVFENAVSLNVDPRRVILAGRSGGGGLAASVALLTRDNGGPQPLAQLLIAPQLGDRHDSVSSRQFSLANGATDSWPLEANQFAWNALLGAGHEDRDVSIYESPARAEDLAGLPQTFIDVGSNEVFRDAAVAFASSLWAGGVSAELHVWPGAFHGFEFFAPTAPLSLAAGAARDAWLRRILPV